MSIEQNAQVQPPIFLNVRKPASAWNASLDPQDIADTDAADVLNMVMDKGYPTPRPGSVLAWKKPTGETNPLLNLLECVTSDRKEYAIAIYGPNIYVRDEVNNQWININGSYTPPTINASYGYTNWNGGIGSDIVYFGNGVDNTMKWQMALSYSTQNQLASDTVITLSSVAQFPASGSIAIQQPNLPVLNVAYTSIVGNTLQLSASLGVAVGNGAAVTMQVQSLTFAPLSTPTSVPKGKIFAVFAGRLIVCNSVGMETRLWYSISGGTVNSVTYASAPEDFSTNTNASTGGYQIIWGGTAEITAAFPFGLYLAVLKGDSMQRVDFTIDTTNNTLTVQVTPLISDNAMGCPFLRGSVKKNNIMYYPSTNAGIFSIAPLITGFQTTIQLQVLSLNIQPVYQVLNFANTVAGSFQTKIFWTCATNTANDTILVYDTLRQYWTRFNNWPVADWLPHNNNFYYGSSQDGNIYQCLVLNTYTDNNNPYTSYTITKRYDHGSGSMPKTETRLFVQGYILQSTKLYCDVMFNEQGSQQVITYCIDGSQPYCVQPISKALGMVMMGLPIMGSTDFQSIVNGIGIFKVYIPLPIRYGFYNIQYKFYTMAAGSQWSLTGIGMNPRVEFKAPANLVINPDGTPAVAVLTSGLFSAQYYPLEVGAYPLQE